MIAFAYNYLRELTIAFQTWQTAKNNFSLERQRASFIFSVNARVYLALSEAFPIIHTPSSTRGEVLCYLQVVIQNPIYGTPEGAGSSA